MTNARIGCILYYAAKMSKVKITTELLNKAKFVFGDDEWVYIDGVLSRAELRKLKHKGYVSSMVKKRGVGDGLMWKAEDKLWEHEKNT